MKFATLKSTVSRDGVLCVVSRDLQRAVIVTDIAPTLQQALEQWREVEPALVAVYDALNRNARKDAFTFDPHKVASPLPRAYQWADGSAYVNHVELVRKARGAEMPASFWTDPLMYQGGSDTFLGPCDPIIAADEAYGIDFEAEVAVITDDVPMGVRAEDALAHIRLFMLVNDVSLRNLIPAELAKGFGFFHSKPSSSFSPVAITPDELGAHFENARIHLPLKSFINEKRFGEPNAGVDMTFSFADLIAHAAHTRALCAGTIIGSGTVSNYDRTKGSSCIAEKRMLELLESGQSQTPWLHFGDRVRIEMCDHDGHSLFGAIDQKVEPVKS